MRDYEQIEMTEYPMDEFICPISKVVYEDRIYHKHLCKYKYCKKGKWNWNKK